MYKPCLWYSQINYDLEDFELSKEQNLQGFEEPVNMEDIETTIECQIPSKT